ncbi:MAG: hypothetical protein G3I09_07565 [Ferrovum sp.]|nr:hypothetical protein [Ferrovum sp.]
MYRFFVIQLVSALLLLGLVKAGFVTMPAIFLLALAQGVLAAILNLLWRAPRWWLPLHLGFLPAALGLVQWRVSPLWYGSLFVILLLVYWNTFRSRVPLFLTNHATLSVLKEVVGERSPRCFVDLGCGTGSVLVAVARQFPEVECMGYEVAPLPWLLGKIRSQGLPNCKILLRSFWPVSLSHADMVYAFLSPVPMSRLWQKVAQEMPEGSVFVSNSFVVPDTHFSSQYAASDGQRTLYLYDIPHGEAALSGRQLGA